MYLKLMIDGATSKPFSASSLPIITEVISYRNAVIEHSRKEYGKNKIGTFDFSVIRKLNIKAKDQGTLFEE
jgi:hypothetical protein